MKPKDKAIHDLREAIKYLLRVPDLNFDSLEQDTITGILHARRILKTTEVFCPMLKGVK
jgi:hypothetical protein